MLDVVQAAADFLGVELTADCGAGCVRGVKLRVCSAEIKYKIVVDHFSGNIQIATTSVRYDKECGKLRSGLCFTLVEIASIQSDKKHALRGLAMAIYGANNLDVLSYLVTLLQTGLGSLAAYLAAHVLLCLLPGVSSLPEHWLRCSPKRP